MSSPRSNGQDVTPDQTLSYLVANIAPGTTIPVELVREGETRRVTLTVGKRPSEEELRQQQQFNPDIEDEDPMEPGDNTVIEESSACRSCRSPPRSRASWVPARIRRALWSRASIQNADAARKNLRRGDIILSANYRQVTTLDDLESIIRDGGNEDRDAVLLRVQRRGASRLCRGAAALAEPTTRRQNRAVLPYGGSRPFCCCDPSLV